MQEEEEGGEKVITWAKVLLEVLDGDDLLELLHLLYVNR